LQAEQQFGMTLHLVKLCVGVREVDELRAWQAKRLAERRARQERPALFHITRMMPKSKGELLDGGSLYWVIRGTIRARQRLVSIESFRDKDGVARCRLGLDPKLVATRPQPRRAFQGWRYLLPKDAPRDLTSSEAALAGMPEALKSELVALGLL
jgi:hypothetical protein